MDFNSRLDRLYRESAPRLLGVLVARWQHFDRAEDALAEAFAEAQRTWPAQGWPEQPEAWLFRTACRHELDQHRHRAVVRRFAPLVQAEAEATPDDSGEMPPDQRLAMFFLCAHPSLSVDTQALLMLRYCAMVPTADIARAFLLDLESTTRRLHRAKTKLETAGIPFDAPTRATWPQRLPPVLATIEVLFDQGYADIGGGRIAESLSRDALHLAETLVALMPRESEVLGLAALLHFCESRRPARLDASGCMVPLHEQDTSRWSVDLIHRGADLLARATSFGDPGPYQWRALVHACHARRRELGVTPWTDIVAVYRRLAALDGDPMVRINWALAEAEAGDLLAACARFDTIERQPLAHFRPYLLAEAELAWKRGDHDRACRSLQHALVLTTGRAERAFIERKLQCWASESAP